MTENQKVELFGKLITKKDFNKEIRIRSKEYYLKTIKAGQLSEYLQNGWSLYRELKTSVIVKKSKPHDVEFEDKVWSLIANLDYDFLNRDRNFKLPYDKTNALLSQQIDVFAKDKETILLIECKAAKENKRGDFKKELEAMAGKMEGLRKSIQYLFPDFKPKIKFILATRNYSISQEDLERLKNVNGIHFDEDTIDYFFALYSQLGVSAKYQLLGNLFEGQDIPELENKVPAVEGKMGGHTYYSFSIEPVKLLKIGYVLHRNKANVNMMPTYQRLIKKSRLKSVHDFIESGGYFPNSIVISIDVKKLNFDRAQYQVGSTLSSVGILHLPKKYRSAFIIDGQHRLFGYTASKYKYSNTIPVVAFLNLSRSEQVRLFMQINENQKTVSKDLRNTLNGDLLWESESRIEQIKALCSRISISLGESRESALFGKISIGEDKRIITMQAIENALKKSSFLGKVSKTKIEQLGSFYNGNLDQSYDRLRQLLLLLFNYFAENSKEEWDKEGDGILLINKGIFGIIMVTSDLITFLIEERKVEVQKLNVREVFNEVRHYLDPIVNFVRMSDQKTREELKSAYGAGGETKYWRVFQKAISETYPEFKPDGLEEFFKKEAKQFNAKAFSYIEDIETELKRDFKLKLEGFFGKRWFEKGLPPNISEKALIDANNKNREEENDDKLVEPWSCITIIAYRVIALKNWQNIFEKEYTMPGEEKINGGKEEKTKWMVKLERIRNQNFHSYSVTEEELGFLEKIHDWLCKKSIRNKFQSEK